MALLFKRHKRFDPRGFWLGDGSYVFVPDHPAYERSVRLLFDEHGHPVEAASLAEMSPKAAARCRWRRCYKLVSLLYVAPDRNFFLRVAMRLLPGNEHECPVLYELVERFVHEVGDDVIRRLILDRGFLDGERIAHCKLQHGIDILIPVRRDMDIYEDALGLLQLKNTRFQPYRPPPREPVEPPRLPHSPERVRKRELGRRKTVEARKADLPAPPPKDVLVRSEVAGLHELRSFSSCSVPLNVIVRRDVFADGHTAEWMLLDTKPLSRTDGPRERRTEYAVRTEIEEGHRQHKCFWDMAHFTSRAFALVLNPIVFALLAYNLLQVFLRSQATPPLRRRSRPRQLSLLATTASVIIIYAENRFATLTPAAYTEMLLTLEEESRLKVLKRLRRLREEFSDLEHTRPP